MVRVCRVVPKDWTRYSPIGNVIPRTRFIVFKTPLNDRLAKKLRPEERFNVSDLFMKLAERGQRLGMVVDLTDTDRYYDKNDIIGMMVEYEKINCPGRGFIEREECVDSFHQAIQNYIDGCEDEEALIGVHCTHGINRSGYLICRFLIERLGWSSHEALEAFEQARGYPIEKGSYVMALHKAFKDTRTRKVESDSDSEERRRRRKNKRKTREDEESQQMGEMLTAFLGELNQQQLGNTSTGFDSPQVNGFAEVQQHENVQQTHWGFAVKKSKYQSLNAAPLQGQPASQNGSQQDSPYVDDEEGEEYEEEYEGGVVIEGGQPQTSSMKRRARRHRMTKMFEVMKRGRFHEIKEMQAEFMSKHGAV